MSTPTPGSGPDEPAGPPPGQGGPPSYGGGSPGSGPQGSAHGRPDPAHGQPTPGYGPPTPDYGQGYGQPSSYPSAPAGFGAAPTRRPGQVTAAAVIGIVIGALRTLLYLLLIGPLFSESVTFGALGLLSLAAAVVLLVGGIQVLRNGGPQLLLYGAYAAIALSLISLLAAMTQGFGLSPSDLLSFVLPILIVFFVRQNGAWFARTGH